jgi:hypothetical protein
MNFFTCIFWYFEKSNKDWDQGMEDSLLRRIQRDAK